MATAKEQLLSMMNPQQARLMDQQLRNQQVAQRAQGAGMLSGLVQAYTGMGDIAQRVAGVTPMGANEATAIAQKKLREESAKKENVISTAVSTAIRSNDIPTLEEQRDILIAEGSQAAVSAAQKIQNKIDKVSQDLNELNATEMKVDASLDIVAKSDLPENLRSQIEDEITSGLLKPEDVNKRITEANKTVIENNKITSGLEAIAMLNISDREKEGYAKALKAGASLTTILQKVVPTEERLTVDTLSLMYRSFTPESVDKFKQEFAKGKRGSELPRLIEQDTQRKVNVASVTKSMRVDFENLVGEYFDDPNVKSVFTDAGIFSEDPDVEKMRAYVADVYTYANRNQILPSEALLRWSAEKNSGSKGDKQTPKFTSPSEIPQSVVDKAMAQNPDATEEQVRQALFNKFK